MNGYAKTGIALLVAAGIGTLIYWGIKKKTDKVIDTPPPPSDDKTPIHTGLNDFKGQSSQPPPPPTNETLPLEMGMTGNNVAMLQKALINVWHRGAVGSADGVLGPKTKGAIEAIGYSLPLSKEDFNNIVTGKNKGLSPTTNFIGKYVYAKQNGVQLFNKAGSVIKTFKTNDFIMKPVSFANDFYTDADGNFVGGYYVKNKLVL